jgi:hypothetical protein
MKLIIFITLILFFSFSCTKEKTPKKTEQFLSLIGETKIVKNWDFKDLTTKESYDLLDNDDIDKIYITFLNEKLLIVHEEIQNGHSYFGWRVWEYELDIQNDRIILKPDILTNYEINRVDEKNLEFSGFHELHLQQQEIDIEMNAVTDLPTKVSNLIQQYM